MRELIGLGGAGSGGKSSDFVGSFRWREICGANSGRSKPRNRNAVFFVESKWFFKSKHLFSQKPSPLLLKRNSFSLAVGYIAVFSHEMIDQTAYRVNQCAARRTRLAVLVADFLPDLRKRAGTIMPA